MSESIRNINAGDTILYKSFQEDVEYFVTDKKVTESTKPYNDDVIIRGTLTCQTLNENGVVKYNDFYCVADGTIPNIELINKKTI